MKKRILLIALLLGMFMSDLIPAMAQGGPRIIYVDPASPTANEDGSQSHPYNSVDEGKAYAQSLSDGGWVYIKNADGSFTKIYVPPVTSGATGVPFSRIVLFISLGLFALALIVIGRYFLMRSRYLQQGKIH